MARRVPPGESRPHAGLFGLAVCKPQRVPARGGEMATGRRDLPVVPTMSERMAGGWSFARALPRKRPLAPRCRVFCRHAPFRRCAWESRSNHEKNALDHSQFSQLELNGKVALRPAARQLRLPPALGLGKRLRLLRGCGGLIHRVGRLCLPCLAPLRLLVSSILRLARSRSTRVRLALLIRRRVEYEAG
jgi:hypothetical protein